MRLAFRGLNDYGEIVIEDTGEVIENDHGEGGKSKNRLDEFCGNSKRTAPKKRAEPKGQANEVAPAEESGPSLGDFLEDIATAPNFEGPSHKSKQALETFTGKQAQEAINEAYPHVSKRSRTR